jgi:hypothetical protein
MKVLEPGKTKEKWTIQHRCTGWGHGDDGCDALLEMEITDLRYRPGVYDEKSESEPEVMFKCPCCGKVTSLGRNEWPDDYRKLDKWSWSWHVAEPEWKEAS